MTTRQTSPAAAGTRNRFDRMEWAGAFGDLGTLIPFVVAYVGTVGMDPHGVLLAFGVSMIVCGAYFRTPMPVQPMKAAGAVAAAQAAQTAVITPAVVVASSLATGMVWLLLGLTGAARRLSAVVPRYVVIGIVLGLGMAFMLEGVKMMAGGWWVAAVALVGTLVLLPNRVIPAMFVLLLFGIAFGLVSEPSLIEKLRTATIGFRPPELHLGGIGLHDFLAGLLFLVIPQLPLTLGNAIIATTDENNRLFPDRPVTEDKLAISTGMLNVVSSSVGGVPMCHGAGGMAGHVAFGARTGGATMILGCILLASALFLSESISTFLAVLPKPILGVILFLTGAQLALGSCDFSRKKPERFATLVTAAFCIWNVGLGFVVGMACAILIRYDRLRL